MLSRKEDNVVRKTDFFKYTLGESVLQPSEVNIKCVIQGSAPTNTWCAVLVCRLVRYVITIIIILSGKNVVRTQKKKGR